jgi:hypothetical protein
MYTAAASKTRDGMSKGVACASTPGRPFTGPGRSASTTATAIFMATAIFFWHGSVGDRR